MYMSFINVFLSHPWFLRKALTVLPRQDMFLLTLSRGRAADDVLPAQWNCLGAVGALQQS